MSRVDDYIRDYPDRAANAIRRAAKQSADNIQRSLSMMELLVAGAESLTWYLEGMSPDPEEVSGTRKQIIHCIGELSALILEELGERP